MDAERRTNELYAKQGRNAQFKNKKERDTYLKKEMKDLENQIDAKKEQVFSLNF